MEARAVAAGFVPRPRAHAYGHTIHQLLLWSGIAGALLYVAANVIVPMHWEGYSPASQTISELSAVGAPTRRLWLMFAWPFTVLMTAFGLGVRISSNRRSLRASGNMLMVFGALGILWPLAPMHLRETIAAGGGTLSDTLHIALGMVSVLLMVVAMASAAMSSERGFRRYTAGSLVVLFAAGALTALDAPRLQANLPTPLMGMWERINIGVFLLWTVALATMLLIADARTVRRRG